jgi:outer membrane protein OmpA-like peptidoglycan-associated protein
MRRSGISLPLRKGDPMNSTKYTAAALLFLAVGAPPASAQTRNTPWVDIETVSVMAGLGGQSGDGQLNLPNLGTNCVSPFTVSGFGAGLQVGVSKVSASGPVANLTQVEDFPGRYTATQGQFTLVGGGGSMSLKNNNNNVSIDLALQTVGINLGISGEGLTIDMPGPPVNAPRVYLLEFGFEKTWVNADSRKTLNELLDAWKCRFVNIDVAGHTDTKEADNLNLSQLRALAVQTYLVGAGVVPSRIATTIAGERGLQVPTPEGVRLRSNRVVVLTIH